MFYRRHLPHWQKPEAALFLTWRLYGSLPRHKVEALQASQSIDAGRAFLLFDEQLDQAAYGPTYLRDPVLAELVVNAVWYGDEKLALYRLSRYVVMANHVHVLFWPQVRLSKITKAIKGFTAREANRLLGRTGEPFWQEESFDHWVRGDEEFNRIAHYIEQNPVKAGLVKRSEDWPWSSAFRRKK
jgi:REP element-mobilizing transposase RayT